MSPRPVPDVDALAAGVRAGRRGDLSRAITLVESRRDDHRALARELVELLLPASGDAVRVGITGVPGVGKSTTIEALGMSLVGSGHRVAVLAVDPSSTRTGGSILGDKTRMGRLGSHPAAFVRPSPTAGTLGGIAAMTREAMVLLEAAGFDVVLVETVGVGQSEVTVAQLVDTFVVLALARTGDQLQGIKRGVLELADVVVVNKADGPHRNDALRAARELAGALRLVHPPESPWRPPVLTMSAVEGEGVAGLWQAVQRHREVLVGTGELERRRGEQQVSWLWSQVREQLLRELTEDPRVRAVSSDLERRVRSGELTAGNAAQQVLAARTSEQGRPAGGHCVS